jgi:hypothetical protein
MDDRPALVAGVFSECLVAGDEVLSLRVMANNR